MIRSTKGLQLLLENTGAATVNVIPTAITKAAQAVVTVADVTGIKEGDLVAFADTGFAELDGKNFTVGTVDGNANTFAVVGGDTTNSTGTLGANPKATVTPVAQMTNICASSISVDANTPGTVSVATYCDPSASIPSVVSEPGNLTMTVYHDPSSAGFKLLEAAADAGDNRLLAIVFPQNGGTLVAEGVLSSFAITDVPLDGAAAWTATFALASRPALRV